MVGVKSCHSIEYSLPRQNGKKWKKLKGDREWRWYYVVPNAQTILLIHTTFSNTLPWTECLMRGIAYLQHSHQPAISYRHRQTKAIEDSCHILVSPYPGLKRKNGVVGRIYRVTLSNYCTHLANLRLRCLKIYDSKTLTSTNRNEQTLRLTRSIYLIYMRF